MVYINWMKVDEWVDEGGLGECAGRQILIHTISSVLIHCVNQFFSQDMHISMQKAGDDTREKQGERKIERRTSKAVITVKIEC